MINGHIETNLETKQDGEDWYVTTFGWTVPEPADEQAVVKALVKRFDKELRDTIQSHRSEE